MAHPSVQRTIQPKISTNRDRAWKKKVKKACQLRDKIIELTEETEYLQGKDATVAPISTDVAI